MALTRAQQRETADLIQRLLGLVDDGHLAADGPAGVALVRRLEGAMLALRAMDGPMVPAVEAGSPVSTTENQGTHNVDAL